MTSTNSIISKNSTEEQLEEAKQIIQQWVDKQSHDRSWYYPDLFNQLVILFDIKSSKEPSLPPLVEFKRGCERYQQEEYKLE